MKKRMIQSNVLVIGATVVIIGTIGVANGQGVDMKDGGPARNGEIAVNDNIVDFGNQKYEIDGVCKIDSESALCWKPDGTPNQSLTNAMLSAIRSPASANRTWALTYGKKQRTLVLKETRTNNGNNSSRYGSPFHFNQGGTVSEGWGQSNGPFYNSSSNEFDGSSSNSTTIGGVFEKSTKEFPFRYMFQNGTAAKSQTIPLKIGPQNIDGNVIEITAITDHPKDPKPGPGINFPYQSDPNAPKPLTDITFRVVSLANPFSTVNVRLADDDGKPIDYVDQKGNVVSQEAVMKWYQEHQQRTGANKVQPIAPFFPAGGYSFEPLYSKIGMASIAPFNVRKETIKSLSVMVSKREVYVWEHVKLDPN